MNASLLLCTDLDRTLIPNGTQPESPGAREHFGRIARRAEVILVYVTGRDRTLATEAIHQYQLPRPAFVIGDVGTTLYDLRSGEWQHWPRWAAEIAPDWAGHDHADLTRMLSGINGLHEQEPTKQNRHKLSYYVPLQLDHETLLREIEARLAPWGVKAGLIWSVDEAEHIGLLDVIPRSATKLHAIEALREALGIPLTQTLFAGDSGNDLPVLVSPVPSVLVANAMSSVRDQAVAGADAAGHRDRLYLATGEHLGMNGNYAAGILEGLVHYHPSYRPVITATAQGNSHA